MEDPWTPRPRSGRLTQRSRGYYRGGGVKCPGKTVVCSLLFADQTGLSIVVKKNKVKWASGDLFKVPLDDGECCLGQVLGQMGGFKNIVNCAFFDIRLKDGDPPYFVLDKLIAVISTTRDLLDEGYWSIIGHQPMAVKKSGWPNEQFSNSGYIGAKTYGSGIVNHFLSAYYGLYPWNGYKDSNYFLKLLVSPSKKPPDSVLMFK